MSPSDPTPDDAVRSLSGLDGVVVVLCEPRDPINIGTTVRAMQNMGLSRLRLVRPANFDPRRVLISAPHGEPLLATTEVFDTLEQALADTVWTAALTARGRRARQTCLTPRQAAPELLRRAREGRVALLFGREDRGLTNEELDQASVWITIPTDPDYASLNLGQAVLLMAYELSETNGAAGWRRLPSEAFEPATHAELEGLFGQVERTLTAIEFLKTGTAPGVMRTVRSVFQRASLDRREAAIFRGAFTEVVKYMRRRWPDAPGNLK